MDGSERRAEILEILESKGEPVSGTNLSKLLKVSRQVIVQDIAILRAEGMDIIATPRGYIVHSVSNTCPRKTIACIHRRDQIEDELKTIIELGGRIIDVCVEHPVYGELRGNLMLSSFADADEFVEKLKQSVSEPLLVLTSGVHLHTIEADNEKRLEKIEKRLREKGYLVNKEG